MSVLYVHAVQAQQQLQVAVCSEWHVKAFGTQDRAWPQAGS
jgi:hypothetical protein